MDARKNGDRDERYRCVFESKGANSLLKKG